ncbi:MAG TPA: FKBP-type peptidyl-prolyl cis-trans isomerase [Ilumatobacter sp.]|nr:FKBP-type peptidyl-prolyl cis-trans isomerase [Ilumatobacter sp.]
MRRSLPLILVAGALILSACGDDETADPSATTAASATTADGSDSAVTTAPVTTVASTMAPVDPDACFDAAAEIDLADYAEGEVPPAIRPCELPTELATTVIRPGTGHEAADGDTLVMDYTGIRSIDGQVFDDSYSRGTPFDFVLGTGRVIAGWDQGFLGAQTGSLIRVDIPAELAYGDTPRGDVIQPGDPLTFLVEVRAAVKKTTEADAPLDLVVDTSTGATEITTTDEVVGDGPVAQAGQVAIVHVMLVRGDNRVVLLETWSAGDAVQIPLVPDSPSLPGLVQGIEGATVGTTRVITMPPSMAFGPTGDAGLGLPGDVDVIAVVEVMGVFGTPTDGVDLTATPVATTPPTATTAAG